MTPIFVRFEGWNRETEGTGILKDQEPGFILVKYPDGRPDETKPIDDLPAHWQEQLRRWNVFGRNFTEQRKGER